MKIAGFLVVTSLLLNPEFMVLGLFIDGIGFELFLMLLEVQIVAMFGYYFQHWFKPVAKPIYKFIQRFDPYFFVPTRQSIVQHPAILAHAIPGFMVLYLALLFV